MSKSGKGSRGQSAASPAETGVAAISDAPPAPGGRSSKNSSRRASRIGGENPTSAAASRPESEKPEGEAVTDEQTGEQNPDESSQVAELPPEVSRIDKLKLRFRNTISLVGYKSDMWIEDHDDWVVKFVDDPGRKLLVAYLEDSLILGFELPRTAVDSMMIFYKVRNDEEITTENFSRLVTYMTVKLSHLDSLLRVMSNIVAPTVFERQRWPDSIRSDFTAGLHKFLSSLSDTKWKIEGKTMLYIPMEGKNLDPKVAAKDKEFVQRLEAAAIHWTRQIREVLSAQESLQVDESAGPIAEIDFWKNRCADLTGISKQLDNPHIKRICSILEISKSAYLEAFIKIADEIKVGSMQAESNLKFLLILKDPCYELAEATPQDIPRQLPKLINLIRMIWTNSEFYKTPDRLTALFKKISNQIIKQCCKAISLDKIFDGYVQSSLLSLNNCIECCEKWKDIYNHAEQLHSKFSKLPWGLDRKTIFAQIDAFVQRCRDLIEVCNCENHFCRFEEGEQAEVPHFAGHKGPEIARGLLQIDAAFQKHLARLREKKATILEVKTTTWHDDYSKFREGVKELEVMMQSVINQAFETTRTVEGGIEILDVFMCMSSREAIHRTIDKKTVEVHQMFLDELNSVKREITQKNVFYGLGQPHYAGAGHWARQLKKRIERLGMLIDRAFFLPQTGVGAEARTQYLQLVAAIDDYIKKAFNEWNQKSERDPQKLLEIPLMCKSSEVAQLMDMNFDRNLLKLLQECFYFERLQFEAPRHLADIYLRIEEFRCMRELVMLVIRDYNRVLMSLKPEERQLFKERIRFLDKKLSPGMNKITWASKGLCESFVQECRLHANKLQIIVDNYKIANLNISQTCVKISESLLLEIDTKRTYENLDFDTEQQNHRASIEERLAELHDRIVKYMLHTYDVFKDDGSDVQNQWIKFTEKTDKMVEEAFRLNVKWSLQALNRGINGDGKSPPNPLFRVRVVLESDVVDFAPTLNQLAAVLTSINDHLIKSIANIKRLPELLTRKKPSKPPINEVIAKDFEIRKTQDQIVKGLQQNSTAMRNYLTTWDSFKEIWQVNKDAFIRRYARQNPPVASFDADIARYTEVANNVQLNDTILTIQFMHIDCSPLKNSILSHCQEWQNKFTSLLRDLATTSLKELAAYLEDSAFRVVQVPQTLNDLGACVELWEKMTADVPNIEAKFQPLQDQFTIIDKYEVTVPQDVRELLGSLSGRWSNFCAALEEADLMIKKQKEKFKVGLLSQQEDLKKTAQSIFSDFRTTGPFAANISSADALAACARFREQLAAFKEQEAMIRKGLNMFKMDFPPSKDIAALEKELEQIETVWQLTADWEKYWGEWKTGRFADLQTKQMENVSSDIFKKLHKLSRELKEKNWEIVDVSKAKVDQFRRTMPLIQDLKNKAMRPRHWQRIKEEMNKYFDENSDDYTLEYIIGNNFDQFADFISELSGAASKEYIIEVGLANISQIWESMALQVAPYKDKGHFKIISTEEIFQSLEDGQAQLSQMKSSRFVKAFEQEVTHWEKTLTVVMDVLDALLQVQKQWIYLENIFLGEDIRKQLPRETKEFDNLSAEWKKIMTETNAERNAQRATHRQGIAKQLAAMNRRLEEINKALSTYLETKRQAFPRFYFISNDDLLKILGEAKNPETIRPHLRKLFDNLFDLKMVIEPQRKEATVMISGDGEKVDFSTVLVMEGQVEVWLSKLELLMQDTLRNRLRECKNDLRKFLTKRDKWIRDEKWPGQLCLTASQIQWTTDVTKALGRCKEMSDRRPLRSVKKRQISMLNKYSEAVRGKLNKVERLKIVAMITIEVHQRDIVDKMYKMGIQEPNAFEWNSQLRFYWDKQDDDCVIKQTITSTFYQYEYLGNSGRLVITPLTDRCYITLTTALHLHKGGSPKGPAGTGKTETTKDLGKNLGMYVIVINCSEGLDFMSMGRMFSGLAQTGAWGCFDEFNRINIEVLSVVAQQILSILSALSAHSTKFVFEGQEIRLTFTCGIFITMNPGYAGRTELPDNLKSMFRPIAMVVPDSNMIAEIILSAEGFGNCKGLAKKVFTLYSLAVQQLSKQDHYDFGLRALTSLLRYGGRKKRDMPTMPDDEVILLAMRDMNIAKLTSVDLPLFNAIVSDLFPGVEIPTVDYVKLREAIVAEMTEAGLIPTKHMITKIIQLFETKNSRHSVMIVGKTLSGKTVTWKMLQATKTRLAKANEPGFNPVKEYPMNPKAVSMGELYGEFDLASSEWTDGILSTIMRTTCGSATTEEKWILFDGPVDAVWIENMNSVMDDNKILTLVNGERIGMPEPVSLLFEVGDLAVASPATVSRCGMVFNDYVDLGWQPYVESWLKRRQAEGQTVLVEELKRLFDKWVAKLLEFKRVNCQELVPIPELNGVISLCRLLDAFMTLENGVDPADTDNFQRTVENWFLFCLIWSVLAAVNEEGRKKIDLFLREIESSFPNKDAVYEYFVDPKTHGWLHWDEKLKTAWQYNPNIPFFKIIVPTVDTVRYNYLVSNMIAKAYPVMLVGIVGTGKTSVAQSVVNSLDLERYTVLIVNMSAQTTSNNVQDIIESRTEKRGKGVFVPVGGKKMLTLVDDLNMPVKDRYGSQPPLELIRMWLDYGFWYNRKTQAVVSVKDMVLMAAMGPPGGGRQEISQRLQSRFNLINMTFPQESQLKRIFGSMIAQKLHDFEDEVKNLAPIVTDATIELYDAVISKFLPTPTKIHYLFNLRDISKVFQGLLRANRKYQDNKPAFVRLWIHECFRVFCDRLVGDKDRESFIALLSDKLGVMFDLTYHNICQNRVPPIFGDFLNADELYEDLMDPAALKKHMQNTLDEYNNTPNTVAMDLVLFKDAIEHISRIVRVIRQPRGNMLLIGIGGSGRQSLTRLAAFICYYNVFQIEVSKNYRKQEFREDIKRLYLLAGVENKPTLFLFTDMQVVEEAFLEDINNVLSSGEVPNLYKADEFEDVKNQLADDAKKDQIEDNPLAMFTYLLDRIRANLHVVLAMSPVGEPFRNRIRQYPAFVNCTTIDLFTEWPMEALLEVADKYVQTIEMRDEDEERLKPNIAKMFALMHNSVGEMSRKMFNQLRRQNYVTPTNYLELVIGYKDLLYNKRKELSSAANKLKNGLGKIEETREKVSKMSVELEQDKQKVAQFQKMCEEYLVVLVQQKREADEQQKAVQVKSEKIGEEEYKCKQLADLAQADLAEAMPALEAAMDALNSLNKNDLTEIKSYAKPPPLVEKVMEAVMVLRNGEPTWAEAKRQLSEPNFIKQLVNFPKDNISDRVLKKIGQYVAQKDFDPEIVGKVSNAARSLCLWVRAMEMYGRIYRVVEPKRQRLNQAMAALKEKQDALAEAYAKLREVENRMAELKKQYEDKLAQKEELRKKSEYTEMMLDRASKLVDGLSSEYQRWVATVADLEERMGYLPGDCLLSAGFLSYMGPFLSEYRDEMLQKIWLVEVRRLGLPCSAVFDLTAFMVKPTLVREWNMQKLPSDEFSTENGIIVTQGRRWPLMVDPQGQAMRWIKNMEQLDDKMIIDLQMPDYLERIKNAVRMGKAILLQNVKEKLDPSLDPVLNKSIVKIGGVPMIKIGDNEVEYNPNFRFYITTKLSNPHYAPEVAAKTTIVNFAIKEQGLEAQLLGIVVGEERPELEQQKDTLVTSIAAGKKKLVELEDEILRLLNETKGSLLDDVTLVNTLQTSKQTSQEVSEQLATAEQTESKIDAAREGYRSSATRASILFFVLNDMGQIDPMYQFSLDAYVDLYRMSIKKSKRSPRLEERIANLNDFHTFAVYRFTCRALFERHKLLFSFHMCARIQENAGKLNMEEYNFFLRGGIVLDKENQLDNPCSSWLPEQAWDNISELEKLPNFHGIVASFEQHTRDWNQWFTAAEPEKASLPGEWDNSANELQRMLIVRSLRPDRVSFCVTQFIVNNLGSKYVEPPILDMRAILDDSTSRTPLIFVLSPGVDPTSALIQLAETCGMFERFHSLSLGQGQAPTATRYIKDGLERGHWVFLANCHLSLSWMPALDKIIDQLQGKSAQPHPDFRLWLSSAPHPDFPIAILQSSIKITTEPPKGLKANMKRLYNLISEPMFMKCRKPDKYRKLLFSLTYFHSVLLERKKFLNLGWNIVYEFNDADFLVSETLLSIYLDEYDETAWDALKYLIAGINYGGHVTDDWDRRLLLTYINDYYCDACIKEQFFKLSSLPYYYIPRDGPLASYKEYISMLPASDHPEAFGQHPNADIASQIQESRMLFETLLSLQPQTGGGSASGGAGESREDKVRELAQTIYKQLPPDIDFEQTVKLLANDPSPLNVVLLQEIERYNNLLRLMRKALIDLDKGIQGLVVMSSELETIFQCMYDGRVPPVWETAYPSMKPLASWTRDLVQRVEFFTTWASTARPPKFFWISAFTFPTGFLTAVLQSSARLHGISIDTLSWEFTVQTTDDLNAIQIPKDEVEGAAATAASAPPPITPVPASVPTPAPGRKVQDGVLVRGLYLQGAGWERKASCLVEASPMQLVCPMPVINFRPVENRKKTTKGIYSCPCYYFPNRAGRNGRASYVVAVDLKSGERTADHWVKRGTALLMSLDS